VRQLAVADPVRHHYAPRFYLGGFTDEDGLVCVYEKGRPGGFRAAPHNTGLEKDFYTVETQEKPRDSALVEKLMATIDDLAAPILRKLVNQEPITAQDRSDFSYFMAFMYLRVPAFRELSQQIREAFTKESHRIIASEGEWFDSLVRYAEEQVGEPMPDDIREEIRQMSLDGSYSLTWGKEHHISHITQAEDWSKTIHQMRWTLHESPKDKPFVTCDNPFLMVSSRDPNRISGLRKRDVSLTFPLHRTLLLEATWTPIEGYVKAPASLVKAYNRRTIRASTRFVFASYRSMSLDRTVQQHIGTSPRVEFETFHKPGSDEAYHHHRIVFGTPSTIVTAH
jgi:uncharacterized protein DUF4238